MPSKELVDRDDLVRARRRADSSRARNAETPAPRLSLAAIQRATVQSGAVAPEAVLRLQRTIGNQSVRTLLASPPSQGEVAITSPVIQRNAPPGGAAAHDWSPKNVPKRVKDWAAAAHSTVEEQYDITLAALASNPTNQGDGKLAYMNGWNHKRFGGHFCLLYVWAGRADGKGWFLNVKGIGRKSSGNDYALDD